MKSITEKTEKPTQGQIKQVLRFVDDMIVKILTFLSGYNLDLTGLVIVGDLRDFFKEALERYSHPRISFNKNDYKYDAKYTKPVSIEEQENILRDFFPDVKLMFDKSIIDKRLPKGAEGYSLIPDWRWFGATYVKAIKHVAETVSKNKSEKSNFFVDNFTKGNVSLDFVSRSVDILAWEGLRSDKVNAFVIPTQFGRKTVMRSDTDSLNLNPLEFELGLFEILIMSLTNPNRFSHEDSMFVVCGGDLIDHHRKEHKFVVDPVGDCGVDIDLTLNFEGSTPTGFMISDKIDSKDFSEGIQNKNLKLLCRGLKQGLDLTNINKTQLQNVIENGNLLQAALTGFVKEASNCFMHMYVKDFRKTECAYYAPKSLEEQSRLLKDNFPELENLNFNNSYTNLPEEAEGYFLIPQWSLLGETYEKAIHRALGVLFKDKNFTLIPFVMEKRCRSKKTKNSLRLLKEKQGSDFLVVSAQFGKNRNVIRCLVDKVLKELNNSNNNEFALGLFEVIIMLITHQNRLRPFSDFGIIIGGDVVKEESNFTPIELFYNGEFYFKQTDEKSFNYAGIPTGFLAD